MRLTLAAVLLAASPAVCLAALPDAGFMDLGGSGAALLELSHPMGQAPAPAGPVKDHPMHGGMGPAGFGLKSLAPDAVPPDVSPYQVRGMDISHYQGDIDWKAVGGAGLSFVYMKATEGGDYVDDHFSSYWAAATRTGLAKGAYHFYNFCDDGKSQAANFIGAVPAEAETLPPVVDLEKSSSCSKMPAKDKFLRDLADFSAAVQRAYGQVPVMYVNDSIYQDYFAGEDVPYTFWVADISHKTAALPDGRAWAFWQYDWSGSVPGVSGDVDLDVYQGSTQELASLERPADVMVASLGR